MIKDPHKVFQEMGCDFNQFDKDEQERILFLYQRSKEIPPRKIPVISLSVLVLLSAQWIMVGGLFLESIPVTLLGILGGLLVVLKARRWLKLEDERELREQNYIDAVDRIRPMDFDD
jgi:hypothetical protein